jgi:hypothetical protein
MTFLTFLARERTPEGAATRMHANGGMVALDDILQFVPRLDSDCLSDFPE